jgi:L-ascorbate metabolism protein UlaG (beta-lactamase superfamily)
MALALRDSVELHVEYDDESPLGTVISGQLASRLKRRFQPAIAMLQGNLRDAIGRGPSLLADLGLNGSGDFLGVRNLDREEVCYPRASDAYPASLAIFRPAARPARVALSRSLAADLASWFGDWQRDAKPPIDGDARELWEILSDLDCFDARREPSAVAGPVTFVGHAAVLLSGARTRVLIDPFLLCRGEGFPTGYQPLTHGDFSPDAVFVTHSHPDHFHVDSLLRLGRDTAIFVPEVSRESALAVDMVYRLKELGFTRVQSVRWHDEVTVGDFRVIALPLYGEQPTTEAVLNPEIRNVGNNYVIEGEGRRYAFIADAGRDHLGDVRAMATAAFERYGAVDVLFGGYRSWSLYPIQYVASSVPQYLLFTPPSLWNCRQDIMNDAHALVDTAERWHARYVVPYADGGAPWYWQLGLGPRLDAAERPLEMHFDPRPEAVVRAAASRSEDGSRPVSSPVQTLIMRPGESLEFDGCGDARLVPNEGHRWPYADSDAVLTMAGSAAEPTGLSRKRVLLRLLAGEEMRRRGLTVSTDQMMDMSDELRREHGLIDQDQMLAWLERAGLSMAEYCEILFDWQGVIELETLMADAIEKRLAGQRAFASMREARRA